MEDVNVDNVEDVLKKIRESGKDGEIMADKILLIKNITGHAMSQTTILREDGLMPFMAVFDETEPGIVREVYLPISTIVHQIIQPILKAAGEFQAALENNSEDQKKYKSPVTKKVLDIPSYIEGTTDSLIGVGITIMNTLAEVRYILQQQMEKSRGAIINPSGDRDTNILVRVSDILNAVRKPQGRE